VQINPLNSPHVALVVSPLRALMQDQLQRCKAMGIKAVAIGRNNEMTNHDKQCELFIHSHYLYCSKFAKDQQIIVTYKWHSDLLQ